jgi:beta-galactosidase
MPTGLPPGALRAAIPITIPRVESLREGLVERGDGFAIARWFEHVETGLEPDIALHDGRGIMYRHGALCYLAGWPDDALLETLILAKAAEAGVATIRLPRDIRVRRAGDLVFAFNYGPDLVDIAAITREPLIIGDLALPCAGVAAWRTTIG